MNLSAPKMGTFVVAVILAVLGFLGFLIPLSIFTTYAFWFVLIGFVVLAVGVLLPNL